MIPNSSTCLSPPQKLGLTLWLVSVAAWQGQSRNFLDWRSAVAEFRASHPAVERHAVVTWRPPKSALRLRR
jgi:hypothetical protein